MDELSHVLPVPGVDIGHRKCPCCSLNMEIRYRAPRGPAQKNWRWICRPCTNARSRVTHQSPHRQEAKRRYRGENAEKIAARKLEWARADREADPEKYRERQRRSHQSLMADPVRHALKLAAQRRKDRQRLIDLKKDPAAYAAFLASERERCRLRYARNARTILSTSKHEHYKRKYGVTLDELRGLWVEQGCACAICECTLDDPTGERVRHRKGSWHLDHCHETGGVRGLLCNRCNMGLGLFGDRVDRLDAAIKYLSDYRATALVAVHDTVDERAVDGRGSNACATADS